MTRGKLELGWGKKKEERATPPITTTNSTDSSMFAEETQRPRRAKGSGDRIGINFRMNHGAAKELEKLAADQWPRTKQDLLEEALDLLFLKYGRPAVTRSKA